LLAAALISGCRKQDLIRTQQVLDAVGEGMQQADAQQLRDQPPTYQPPTPELNRSFRSPTRMSDIEHRTTLNQRVYDMDRYGY
jgi:hypothetical protein